MFHKSLFQWSKISTELELDTFHYPISYSNAVLNGLIGDTSIDTTSLWNNMIVNLTKTSYQVASNNKGLDSLYVAFIGY